MSTAPVRVPNHPPTGPGRNWSGWRTAAVVLGLFTAALSAVLLVAGTAVALVGQQRDGSGYLNSGPALLSTETYALSVPDLDVDVMGPDAAAAQDLLGRIRIEVEGHNSGGPLFLGIGPSSEVATYLADVGHAEISDVKVDPLEVTYLGHDGSAPGAPPTQQPFWAVSQTGTGSQDLTWDVASGDWSVVIMNADGSAGVDADVTVGATLPVLRWVAVGVFIVAGLLVLASLLLIVIPLTTRGVRHA